MWMPFTSSLLPFVSVERPRQRHSLSEDTGMALVLSALGIASKIYMNAFNTTTIFDGFKLEKALAEREAGVGLISVSNHTSAIDDPLTIASLIPASSLLNPSNVRWTMCATNRCFINPFLSRLVALGKALPITRGQGVFQEGMDKALQRVNDGDWVHIFPEGTRSSGGGNALLPLKPGVGRLVADAAVPPLVVPFYHIGMDKVLPKGRVALGVGHHVHVIVGDPIRFDDLLAQHRRLGSQRHTVYAAIAERIHAHLMHLRAEMLQRVHQHQQPPPPQGGSGGDGGGAR